MVQSLWPTSYSESSSFVRAIFLAEGHDLVIVGTLPSGVSRETLQPFLSESFRTSSSQAMNQHAWLNLTDGHGQSLYVEAMELKSGEGTLAICSSFPGFKLLHELLLTLVSQVENHENPEEYLSKLIHSIVYAMPPAMPGLDISARMAPSMKPRSSFAWEVADIHPLDNDDISLDCSYISAASLVAAWEALIFERPLVIVSSNSLTLTPFVTFLNSLLAPLRNAHPTVPILPPTMIDILEAPFPFLVGVRSDTYYQLSPSLEMSPSVTVLDLDTGVISTPNAPSPSSIDGEVHSMDPPPTPPFLGSNPTSSPLTYQESVDVDISNASLPPAFLAALSRKVGSGINAQRVVRMSSLDGSNKGCATTAVKDVFIEATNSLLSPRFLPVSCTYDMLSLDEEEERTSDPTLMAAQLSEKTALSKLAKGIISEAEYREIVSHNAAIVAASKVPVLPSKRFHVRGEDIACGGLFLREVDRIDDTVTKRFVWCEQDQLSFTVWPIQTAVPSCNIKLEEMTGISISPANPDGLCFSISTQHNDRACTYLFEAFDEYSADHWIRSLEKGARLRGGARSFLDNTDIDVRAQHHDTPSKEEGPNEAEVYSSHFFNNEDALDVSGAEYFLCRRALLETQHVSVYKSEIREILQLEENDSEMADELALAVLAVGTNGSVDTSSVSIDGSKIVRRVGDFAKTVTTCCNVPWLTDASEAPNSEATPASPPSTPPRPLSSPLSPKKTSHSVSLNNDSLLCGKVAVDIEDQVLNMCQGLSDENDSAIGSPELRTTLFGRLSAGLSKSASHISSTDSVECSVEDSDLLTRLCKLQRLSAYFFDASYSAHQSRFMNKGRLAQFEVPLDSIIEKVQLVQKETKNVTAAEEIDTFSSSTTDMNNKWCRLLHRANQYDAKQTRRQLLTKVMAIRRYTEESCTDDNDAGFEVGALSSLESLLLDEVGKPREALVAASKGLSLDVRRNMKLLLHVLGDLENVEDEAKQFGNDNRKPLFEDERFSSESEGFTLNLLSIIEKTRRLDNSLILYAQARLLVIAATRYHVAEAANKEVASKKHSSHNPKNIISRSASMSVVHPSGTEAPHSMIDPEYGTVLNYGPLQNTSSTKGSDAIKIVSNLLALLIALVRFQQPTHQGIQTGSLDSGGARSPSLKTESPRNSEVIDGCRVTKPLSLQLTKEVLRGVGATSGFTLFVKQSWQLQEVSIGKWLTKRDRTDNERLCFLLNLYNLMTLHGMIARGPPSTTVAVILGRCLFQGSIRYRVGDMTLDLVQVEHALLRAGLSQASLTLIGAIGSPCRPFSKTDPRDCLRLRRPPPSLSFGLCTFAESSPVLFVFRDPLLVEEQLSLCMKLYIRKHIRIDMRARSVHMGEYLQWFSKDFGSSKREALQNWLSGKKVSLADFRIKIVGYNWNLGCEFVQSIEGPRPLKGGSGSLVEQRTTRSDDYWSKGTDKFGW